MLVSLFTAATSKPKEKYAPSKLAINDIGFEPNGWSQAMTCVEKDKWLAAAHKELARQIKNGTRRRIPSAKATKGRLRLDLH